MGREGTDMNSVLKIIAMRGIAGFLRILLPTITPIRNFSFNYFFNTLIEDILVN